MNFLKSLGGFVLGVMGLVALIFVSIFFIKGGATMALIITPFLVKTTSYLTTLCIFILLPLAFIRKTRAIGAVGLLICSYVFGLTVWLLGFITTYTLWGFLGLFIGLIMGGVGVVPLGILASMFNGIWSMVGYLLWGIFITYGARSISFYVDKKTEEEIYNKMQDDSSSLDEGLASETLEIGTK